jgi:hypothetical protein
MIAMSLTQAEKRNEKKVKKVEKNEKKKKNGSRGRFSRKVQNGISLIPV